VISSKLFFQQLILISLWVSCAKICPALSSQAGRVSDSLSLTQPTLSLTAFSKGEPDGSLEQRAVLAGQSTKSSSVGAFQSLARLIEQHDCRSSRSNSSQEIENGNRFKVAALLFSCLEGWNEKTFDRLDRSALQSLRSEFKLELVALQGSSVSEPLLASVELPGTAESVRYDADQDVSTVLAIGLAQTANSQIYRRNLIAKPQGQVLVSLRLADPSTHLSAEIFSGISADVMLRQVDLFGSYSTTLNDQDFNTHSRAYASQTWTTGMVLRGIVVPQSLLAVSATTVTNSANLSQPAQFSYEAFYQFPLTEQLTISPSIVVMPHTSGSSSSSDVRGSLQASFSF
jgi:hypothetical protein